MAGRAEHSTLASLSVSLHLVVAYGQMPTRDWLKLAPGKVLRPTAFVAPAGAANAHFLLSDRQSHKFRATVRAHSDGLELMTLEDGDFMPLSDAPASLDLGDLPVNFLIEAGEIRLRVDALSQLAPGQILQPTQALSERVWLRQGERRIARGVLVDVDGELAVKIEAVFEEDATLGGV